jgi:heme A synthase
MEFLNLCLMFVTAWLIWKRPEKERLARRLLVVSVVLMVFLFMLGTRTSLLPGLNY